MDSDIIYAVTLIDEILKCFSSWFTYILNVCVYATMDSITMVTMLYTWIASENMNLTWLTVSEGGNHNCTFPMKASFRS